MSLALSIGVPARAVLSVLRRGLTLCQMADAMKDRNGGWAGAMEKIGRRRPIALSRRYVLADRAFATFKTLSQPRKPLAGVAKLLSRNDAQGWAS